MDTQKAQQFLKKTSQLPPAVEFYFGSKTIADSIAMLNSKYQIPAGYLSDLITDIVLADFDFNGVEARLKKDLNVDEKKAKQIMVDFLGAIFLPIDEYLKNIDIKKELAKHKGQAEQYQEAVEKFKEELEDEYFDAVEELLKTHEELVDPEEEERAAINIFENNLIDVLRDNSKEALSHLNGGLIYLLFNKKGFKEKIFKVLFDNETKLTHKKFILGGKAVRPTVGNWIKDFIKYYGTENFNNVVLTKYITTSPNVKILDEEEKKLVRKLLQVYRNIKFFPESMGDAPPEEWEIIPTERTGEKLTKARRVSGPPETEEEKEMKTLKQMEEKYDEKSLERLALEEEIKKKRKIEELKIVANKYKEGSLERRAIEEEIRRLGD